MSIGDSGNKNETSFKQESQHAEMLTSFCLHSAPRQAVCKFKHKMKGYVENRLQFDGQNFFPRLWQQLF
jgi:hypothetical protein